jgi:hypothetical protein
MGNDLAHQGWQRLAGKRRDFDPSRIGWRRRACRKLGGIDREFERKVGKDMTNDTGRALPLDLFCNLKFRRVAM